MQTLHYKYYCNLAIKKMIRQTSINAEMAEVPTSTGAGSFRLLKLSKLLLANKLNFWYTLFIFVNHFAYVSSL